VIDDQLEELPTEPYHFDDEMMNATRGDGQPRVRVYPWQGVAVVIGRGGKQHLELDCAAIARDGVTLFRRPGGGCAVVLDPGNVILSLALPLPGVGGITSAFAAISTWLAGNLARVGVPGVRQEGVSDLAIQIDSQFRKIGGSCVYRTRGLLYYSTTLLVDPDLDLVERYLPHPPREPDYRAGRKHRDFMGRLGPLMGSRRGHPEAASALLAKHLANEASLSLATLKLF
jgi:lipoate-protein ligase A